MTTRKKPRLPLDEVPNRSASCKTLFFAVRDMEMRQQIYEVFFFEVFVVLCSCALYAFVDKNQFKGDRKKLQAKYLHDGSM